MPARRSSTRQPANAARSDRAVSYNEFKEYERQKYTGMKIGRSHKWYYDQGEWKETKVTPYTTSLTGLKFKIAHGRAGSEKWSATPRTQRKRMISFLRSVLADLEKQSDREGVIAGQEAPAARKRTARAPRGAKNAAGRQRGASRGSTNRATRGGSRVRSTRRSRVPVR
jgi:hypothetical protein